MALDQSISLTFDNMNQDIIKSFFRLLDDYLIGDLNTMIYKVLDMPIGGLSYPSVHTILCGMELLGIVLSKGKKDEHAFGYFWDNYFVKDNSQYNDKRLQKIFRYTIRNGTAHFFLVKFGIQLTKRNKGNLTKTQNDELNIDIKSFYLDFQKTYQRIKNESLNKKNKQLQNSFIEGYRILLNELQATKQDVNQYIQNIPEFPTLNVNLQSISSGASGVNYNQKTEIIARKTTTSGTKLQEFIK
ncbi:hypothetical protein A2011_00165 [candidate division CPR3 bacterium GWE2_35_7]|nr:MAG: hypothetical protein A2011_00165 [candidate division CPR3 bacterium GWE2_35_7]